MHARQHAAGLELLLLVGFVVDQAVQNVTQQSVNAIRRVVVSLICCACVGVLSHLNPMRCHFRSCHSYCKLAAGLCHLPHVPAWQERVGELAAVPAVEWELRSCVAAVWTPESVVPFPWKAAGMGVRLPCLSNVGHGGSWVFADGPQLQHQSLLLWREESNQKKNSLINNF